MIRNLKVLLLAAMALTAFGALSAAGAQAAEEKFHCSVVECRVRVGPDGTGATTHQVFIFSDTSSPVRSFSTTCASITGEAFPRKKQPPNSSSKTSSTPDRARSTGPEA